MEEANKKYNNFISFLKDNITQRHHAYFNILSTVPLANFLDSLKQHDGKSPHEITCTICEKLSINMEEYSDDIKNRFERYIEYFQKCSKTMK